MNIIYHWKAVAAIALVVLMAPVADAQSVSSAVSLTVEPRYEAWRIWHDPPSAIVSGQGIESDSAEPAPAMLYRLEYFTFGFKADLEYETSEAEFAIVGKSHRQRYALNVEQYSTQGPIAYGMYLGFRYFDFEFANPTQNLTNHDHFEVTMGYTLRMNPHGPGLYYDFRLVSPTIFWLFLIGSSDSNAEMENTVAIPLGLEVQIDAGYRLWSLPLDIGLGYKMSYYSTYPDSAYNAEYFNNGTTSGITHGIFLLVKMDLWFVKGPNPQMQRLASEPSRLF